MSNIIPFALYRRVFVPHVKQPVIFEISFAELCNDFAQTSHFVDGSSLYYVSAAKENILIENFETPIQAYDALVEFYEFELEVLSDCPEFFYNIGEATEFVKQRNYPQKQH